MARLCLCINQVAKSRNMRKTKVPDPAALAIAAEMAGIDGIVAHLKEDRSDVTDRDINVLKEVVTSHFNLAIGLREEMIKKAVNWLPDMVTLLPSTQEHKADESLDVIGNMDYVESSVRTLRAHNIVVTLLIDPVAQQIKAAARSQADYIQFNTAPLQRVDDYGTMNDFIEDLRSAAIAANKIGMGVMAGRGLGTQTLREINDISYIEEFNVGWGMIARAMLVGIEQAVKDFQKILS
ncbi:MAG: pyridoxine 5'-phosphate synthase [candidate division KSB1 bacterium]|nr:pyridoxine 5'-phosphate synthase [candidate division KSB1 bacterium]